MVGGIVSERIEVGDLVMVVRGHICAVNTFGGIPMEVMGIGLSAPRGYCCSRCGARGVHPQELYARFHPIWKLPVSYLKKIRPLMALTDRREEATA